ncbi:MAG: hypothetical protein KDJ49_04670 [Alphaproteobacteria bacterium]|nr:hypothetical protein [Alphaproteobacteria bacterium]USO06912.1 MAG: hypothetical protein H6866_05540 [Rhodospirillales bacterium]
MPALETCITKAQARIETIVAGDSDDIMALAQEIESLFHDINHVSFVFGAFAGSKRSAEIAAMEGDFNTKYDSFSKSVFQNPALSARFKALFADGAHGRQGEDAQLLDVLNRQFLHEGAYLDAEQKQRLCAIDQDLIALAAKFSNNIEDAKLQHAVHVTDKAMLEGLDEATLAAFRKNAADNGKEGWLVLIERLSVDTLLSTAANRDFRKMLLQAIDTVGTQAPSDNRPLLPEFARLRHERAQLLGFSNYAAFALDGTMPGTLGHVQAMIDEMAPMVLKLFSQDIARIQDYARENGGPDVLEPYDAAYWAQRYQNAFFSFDGSAMSEYLPMDRMLDGYFAHAQRLFGLNFIENDQLPRLHDDIRVFDVADAQSGAMIGYLYVDPYAREQKIGGAWMSQIQRGSATHLPAVSLNLNQLKPDAGRQTLMSVEEVSTLFHEGGHAMHGLLGAQAQHYQILQGTNNTPEFVEIHSTLQERWATSPVILSQFARHHETGEKIPESLMDAYKAAESFYKSAPIVRLLQNAAYDLTFHAQGPDFKDADDTHARAALGHPLAPFARPYPLPRFRHLFGDALSKYAAGYYGYFWAYIFSAHGFAKFARSGDLYDPALSARLRQFYAQGASRSSAEIYAAFARDEATPVALMAEMGLKPDAVVPPAPAARPSI